MRIVATRVLGAVSVRVLHGVAFGDGRPEPKDPESILPILDPSYFFSSSATATALRCLTTSWLVQDVVALPTDLFVYRDFFHEVRPEFIVEPSTYRGGSAYYPALRILCATSRQVLQEQDGARAVAAPTTTRARRCRDSYLSTSRDLQAVRARHKRMGEPVAKRYRDHYGTLLS
jgi:hypothetical protein